MTSFRRIGERLREIPLVELLNARLFEATRYSAAHEIPRSGLFRSGIARWIFGLWLRFLAPGGRAFFVASFVFLLFGAATLEFQGLIPLLYAGVVWLVAFAARPLFRPLLFLNAQHPPRVAAGESLRIEVEIEAPRGSSGGFVIAHRLPASIAIDPTLGAPLPPLKKGEKAQTSFHLRPDRRGIYELRGFRVESDFPFGLFQSARIFEIPSRLVVYPRFNPLDRLELPMTLKYQPGGVAFAAMRGETVEYIGNRDYREGDEVRHIDWRATARLGTPVVREYREEYFLRAALVLDTHLARLAPELEADLERAISLCAACADVMNRTDYLIDILAAGPNLYHLLAGRGLASLDQVLDILAAVEPTRKAPWTTLRPAVEANLERLSSVVCLFLDWDDERRAFAEELASSGVALKIVIVRDAASGPTKLDPLDSWPEPITVLGARELESGVRNL